MAGAFADQQRLHHGDGFAPVARLSDVLFYVCFW